MPRLHLLLGAAALLLGRPLLAQTPEAGSSAASPPIIGPGSTPDVQLTEIGIAPPDSHKASLLVAPIPFYNSQLGAGLVGMVGVLKRLGNEPTTPASALGTFGMITTNGTWGIGLGGRAHLGDDAWRTVVGGGYFDIRFQYYGTGGDNENSVDLRQTIVPIRVEALRRVTRGIYVGMQAQYAKVRTGVELDTVAYDLPPFDIEPRTSDELLLTPMFELDTRDDQFYPTRGWLLDASASFLSAKLASDSTMQRYDVLATWQHGWDEARNVLAAALQACHAAGEVPINHLCIVGALNGLRGLRAGPLPRPHAGDAAGGVPPSAGPVRGDGVRRRRADRADTGRALHPRPAHRGRAWASGSG